MVAQGMRETLPGESDNMASYGDWREHTEKWECAVVNYSWYSSLSAMEEM